MREKGVQTLGGQKLMSCGQLHMGTTAAKAVKLRAQSPNEVIQYGCIIGIPSSFLVGFKQTTKLNHSLNELASSDGSLSYVSPVSEKLYRRLYSLYSRMVTGLQHVGGLNPRGFR